MLEGVPAGLMSSEGGPESALGPIENLGVCLGCAGTADFSNERGMGTALTADLSRLLVADGVSGGECTVEAGGEARGDGCWEPAGMCILLGVCVPEGTLEAGVEPGNESASKA